MKDGMKQRDYYFDNVKFILILLVVVSHAIRPMLNESDLLKTLYLTMFSFHMPLFILIAGYFAKNFRKPEQNKKILVTIFIPYVIFQTLYLVFDYVLYRPSEWNGSIFDPYWIMWFLLSLFLWRLILPYFIQLKHPLILSVILAILIGYVSDADDFLSLSRTVAFFPFFLAGFYLKRHHFEKLFSPWKRVTAVLGLIGITAFLYYLEFHSPLGLSIRKWLYFVFPYEEVGHGEWYAGVHRLFFYGLAVLSSIFVLTLIPQRKSIISRWGARSLYVYVWHGFFIEIYKALDLKDILPSPYQHVVIMAGAVLLTCFLASNFVQKITRPLVQPRLEWLFQKNNR
ncbi:acyltransferase family protein [Paludifilum halophilum]|uniref:Acyltransferase 3 domain-containing protein n=1 Tax=Paludifilum halophilum TaxID=1642702 RepID=A0A235B9W7_9BACL|nr:acyltransferase family protein [Paludifilum halophilum]OYD09022.1 hypothetical protein CHM34_04410 [Paludifilum halophilum]